MATVTFILGLCGSGKSHRAAEMAAELKLVVFDEGFLHDEKQHQQLVAALRRGDDCVVVEIAYCRQDERQLVIDWISKIVPGTEIKWVAFENNLEKANLNCCRRTDKTASYSHMRINCSYHPQYTIPDSVEPLPIHQL